LSPPFALLRAFKHPPKYLRLGFFSPFTLPNRISGARSHKTLPPLFGTDTAGMLANLCAPYCSIRIGCVSLAVKPREKPTIKFALRTCSAPFFSRLRFLPRLAPPRYQGLSSLFTSRDGPTVLFFYFVQPFVVVSYFICPPISCGSSVSSCSGLILVPWSPLLAL